MIPVAFTEERHGFRQYIVPRTFSENYEFLIENPSHSELLAAGAERAPLAARGWQNRGFSISLY